MIGTNTMQSSCYNTLDSESGLKLTLDSYFHWYLDYPCRFEFMHALCYYVDILMVYSVLKGYGCLRVKQVVSAKFIGFELSCYFLIYYALLIKQMINDDVVLNYRVLFNGFAGCFLFFIPILVYGLMIAFVCRKD